MRGPFDVKIEDTRVKEEELKAEVMMEEKAKVISFRKNEDAKILYVEESRVANESVDGVPTHFRRLAD